MPKRVTIKDIAKRADVSVATVSYVLNNTRYVSPDLHNRIQQAIAELGYTPNLVARSLRQSQTKTIGLIVPDNSNPFFAEIAKGVEDAGFNAGYSVILCNSNAMLERELAYFDVLRSKQVDGIIFFAATAEIRHLRPVIEGGIPAVVFNPDIGDMAVDQFMIDNVRAGSLVTEHLIDLGHRQIACIQPASDETPSQRRVIGFKSTMKAHGLSWDEALLPRGDNLIAGGARATAELLESGRSFTAVFCTNDAMAIGCIRTLRDHGVRVPQDVSAAGVDDIALASIIEPPLTTVRQPKYEAGKQAVEMLVDRMMRQYVDAPRHVQLEISLVVRQSTAPPPP